MKKILFLLMGAPYLLHLSGQAQSLHTLSIKSPRELRQFFDYAGRDVPIISGHRGGTIKGYPENSLGAFENTLRSTPAFFEVDPRLTKDSVIVLMHDATLDRTTTGTGKVSDHTWAELKALRLKDLEGNVTAYGIPTLEEVIRWSKGKTVLNLDHKDVPLELTARLIKRLHAEDRVLLTVHSAEEAKFYYSGNKELMFSAHILTPQALAAYESSGVPWAHIMAYIGPRTKAENKVLLDSLHARGVLCMISAAPSYDKLKDTTERAAAYRAVISWGADVIESDLPTEAAAAIRPLMPAKSRKSKFFKKPAPVPVAQRAPANYMR